MGAVFAFAGGLAPAKPGGPAAPDLPVADSIAFSGNRAIPEAALLARLPLRPGRPFTPEQLRFSVQALEAAYQDQGYWKAAVAARSLSAGPGRVALLFDVKEGPQYRLRNVAVFGNRLVEDKVVLRELGLKSGDLFSQTALYEAHRRLFMSGYFERADVNFATAPDHQMDVSVQLKERPTQFLKGSLGYGAQTKERVTAGYEDRDFLGNARRLDIQGTYSGFLTNPDKYRTAILQAQLAQPYFLNTSLEGLTSVSREYRERESYDSITTAWHSSLNRRFGERLSASLNFRYDGTRVSNVIPEAQAETAGFYNVLGLGPSFTYEDTDDAFLPEQGWHLTGLFERGFRLLIGDLLFYKNQLAVSHYQPVVKHVTLMTGAQAGFIVPQDPNNPIPIQERFTLGGANTVRGYAERDLGPKDELGRPLGGEGFLAATAELRYPIYKKIFGVSFVDGGQLWRRDPGETWPHVRVETFDDLLYGAGFGIRFLSPVGPVRLEFGYKLNPLDEEKRFFDRTEIHFALGEPF